MFPIQAINKSKKALYCLVAIKVASKTSEENGTIVAAVKETVSSVKYTITNLSIN